MWKGNCNSDSVRPAEIDSVSSPTGIYVRKDFVFVPEKTEGDRVSPAHWEWKEMKLTREEFELYMDNKALKDYLDMIS